MRLGDEGYGDTIPVHIYVTASDNWNDFLGKMVSVAVTGQGFNMKIVEAPKSLPADGVTTGTVVVQFVAKSGAILPDAPCIISWVGAEVDGVGMAAAVSDDRGEVTFQIPASKRIGPGEIIFGSEMGSNVQVLLNYVAPPANGNPTGSQLKPATTGN